MRVLILMLMKQGQTIPPPTPEALLAMHEYNEELQKAGVLLDLAGLTPPSSGARVKFTGSKRTVVDGPFTEAKEMIAGYQLLEVKSLAEAIEWAKRAPFGRGVNDDLEIEIEIRPLFDPSEFDVPGEAEERARRPAEKT